MRVVNGRDVEILFPMADAVEAMSDALRLYSDGVYRQPPRIKIAPDNAASVMGLMPVHCNGERPLWGIKVMVLSLADTVQGFDVHQGAVMVQDGETGIPIGIVEASSLTKIRTAAVSAAATKALARSDAQRVTIVGLGVQARSHAVAMRAVLPKAAITFTGRRPDLGEMLAAEYGAAYEADAEMAVSDADVVCTVTSARTPIIRYAWLRDGCHINAIGSHAPDTREIDGETVANATVFVDSRAHAELECGEYRMALAEGLIGEDHIRAEIGAVIAGNAPGRTSPQEITLFKSLGLAAEDLAAAALILERARANGRGIVAEW